MSALHLLSPLCYSQILNAVWYLSWLFHFLCSHFWRCQGIFWIISLPLLGSFSKALPWESRTNMHTRKEIEPVHVGGLVLFGNWYSYLYTWVLQVLCVVSATLTNTLVFNTSSLIMAPRYLNCFTVSSYCLLIVILIGSWLFVMSIISKLIFSLSQTVTWTRTALLVFAYSCCIVCGSMCGPSTSS